jgi:signal transduction histidine kinase
MNRCALYLFLCAWVSQLGAVEIIEADPALSGRLIGPPGIDAFFGRDSWADEFRLNDYLVGSIRMEDINIEGAVLFAFRINQRFVDELARDEAAQFMFTVPSLHEGDAQKVLPVEVFLLEKNADSARLAAEARPIRRIGMISKGELEAGRLYRYKVENLKEVQAGDVIWVGLNARNPIDNLNHNFLVGGDMISLPGSVPPMLVAGGRSALEATVMGMSSLTLLHRPLNASARPSIKKTNPTLDSKWINPFTSQEQIKQFDAIYQVLDNELEKLPIAQRVFRERQLGFHSSHKPLTESWSLNLPVNGVATAICLVPALKVEGQVTKPFAFPKRFSIVANMSIGGGKQVIADWTQQDFPQQGCIPVVFSFPWMNYESIEFKVYGGELCGNGHFFALEELFLYRPLNEKPCPTVVEMADEDGIHAEPYWSPDYLTDGLASLGPAYMDRLKEYRERDIPLSDGALGPLEIHLALEKQQLIWSLHLYPISNSEDPALPSVSMPERVFLEFANDAEFATIVHKIDASPYMRPLTTGGNPINIRFDPISVSFIRLRCEGIPVVNGISQFGLAEIRANDAHSMVGTKVSLRGFPPDVNPQSFCDDRANGYRLGDPLPWIMRLTRQVVMSNELEEVKAAIEFLRVTEQRTIRALIGIAAGTTLVLFSGVLIWQKRKSAAETMRIRRRIQQDLHDEIGSNLGTISLITSHLLRADLPKKSFEELSDVNRSAREATSSLREVIWLTDKSILTLDKAFIYMDMRAEQMVHDCELIVELPKSVPAHPISSVFKRNLFLLFTEAMHNCLKHAQASRVVVHLGVTGSTITVKVSDNGRGFDLDTVREGFGLQSMRDRAAQLAGNVIISSKIDSGTTVEFTAKLSLAK